VGVRDELLNSPASRHEAPQTPAWPWKTQDEHNRFRRGNQRRGGSPDHENHLWKGDQRHIGLSWVCLHRYALRDPFASTRHCTPFKFDLFSSNKALPTCLRQHKVCSPKDSSIAGRQFVYLAALQDRCRSPRTQPVSCRTRRLSQAEGGGMSSSRHGPRGLSPAVVLRGAQVSERC
jgi:hypothetical protein